MSGNCPTVEAIHDTKPLTTSCDRNNTNKRYPSRIASTSLLNISQFRLRNAGSHLSAPSLILRRSRIVSSMPLCFIWPAMCRTKLSHFVFLHSSSGIATILGKSDLRISHRPLRHPEGQPDKEIASVPPNRPLEDMSTVCHNGPYHEAHLHSEKGMSSLSTPP